MRVVVYILCKISGENGVFNKKDTMSSLYLATPSFLQGRKIKSQSVLGTRLVLTINANKITEAASLKRFAIQLPLDCAF